LTTRRIAAAFAVLGVVVATTIAALAGSQARHADVDGRSVASTDRPGGPAPKFPKSARRPASALLTLTRAPFPSLASASPPAPTAAAAPQQSAASVAAQPSSLAPSGRGPGASAAHQTAPVPDGVPAAEVGALTHNDSAADIWSTWDYTSPLEGADCDTFGTVALSTAGLDLATDGQFGNCARIQSPAAYGYGIFEARIWVQAGPNGTIANWPAFYLNGPDWPVGGEIDAFEAMFGYDGASFHYGVDDSTISQQDEALKAGWNVVDVVWKPDSLAVYYNGQQFVAWESPVITSQPMWITFDTTTGSDGYTTGQPSTMYVDYLRIWALA
jgi:hypothetical protein